MKRLLSILLGIVLISAFAATLYFLYSKSDVPAETWEVEAPFVTAIVKKTVATGSVVPRQEVEIKPRVSGIVETLFVEPGDQVTSGDAVARIRIVPDMVSLANAESRVQRARIQLDNSEVELQRSTRLREEGVVADADHRQVQLAWETAKQELAAAQEYLELIRRGTTRRTDAATNTVVRATVSGMVLEVGLEQGDSVIESNTFNEGTTIATIADMDELVFEGKVDESEVGKLRTGMELLLTVGALEDHTLRAVLEHIAPKGVEEDGAIQFGIRAALHLEGDLFVRANYSATADIVLDRRDEVLAIRERLLQFDGTTPFIEVEVGPQSFERREVELGLSDGLAVEVLSGVAEDEAIKVPA